MAWKQILTSVVYLWVKISFIANIDENKTANWKMKF